MRRGLVRDLTAGGSGRQRGASETASCPRARRRSRGLVEALASGRVLSVVSWTRWQPRSRARAIAHSKSARPSLRPHRASTRTPSMSAREPPWYVREGMNVSCSTPTTRPSWSATTSSLFGVAVDRAKGARIGLGQRRHVALPRGAQRIVREHPHDVGHVRSSAPGETTAPRQSCPAQCQSTSAQTRMETTAMRTPSTTRSTVMGAR